MPISTVPPSPAITTTLPSSLLCSALRAISIPEATAAAFSKREWIHGTFQADCGYCVEMTSMQPVAFATNTFAPVALRIACIAVSYTHLRAHETDSYLVCRLLPETKKQGEY